MDIEAAAVEYLAHLRVERGLSDNTLAAYGRDLSRYVAFLRARGIEDVAGATESDVEAFALAAREGSDGASRLAPSSAGRLVVAVRGWHRFAALEGWSAVDPTAQVRPPQAPRRLPKAISIDEVARLLAAAGPDPSDGEWAAKGGAASSAAGLGGRAQGAASSDAGTPRALRDRALLEVLYATGARISEVVGLDVDDIDTQAVRAAVRLFGKGRKERIVPLGAYARRAVEAYLVRGRPALAAKVAGRGTPALFRNQRGGRMSRQSAWAVIQAAAERAGLSGHVSPHTLRHCFATHLLAGGADIRVVQELLGHASVTTTQIYTKVTPDALREVYAAAHPRAR